MALTVTIRRAFWTTSWKFCKCCCTVCRRFDPEQETEFLKYAKHYVRDGPLFCRMMVEAGSFASLAEYRHVRQIGAIYNNSAKTAQKSFPSLPSKADTRMKAYLRMNC